MKPQSPCPILICDRFDLDALSLLKSDSSVNVRVSNTLGSNLPPKEELEQAQGLIVRSRTKITRELLSLAPNLKFIITSTSGYDHIDLKATSEFAVQVMYTPEANAASASELTWSLALACARRSQESYRAMKAGDWRREALVGRELNGKTWGVIGCGRIGSRVARIAQAFGMKTLAFDPYLETFPEGVLRVGLDECLKLSDFVSFHVPATLETQSMINAARFSEMNHHAIIINTSRGTVFSERDLILALKNSWIAGAGLDVFEQEPLPRDSQLFAFPNVVLTPHLGATTAEAFSASSREAALKALNFVKSQAVTDPLPPLNAPWFQLNY